MATLKMEGSPTTADNMTLSEEKPKIIDPVDLTVSRSNHQSMPPQRRYWRTQPVRRNKEKTGNSENFNETYFATHSSNTNSKDFRYISGPKYYFQRFVRQYPVAALCVWIFLFSVELANVVLYIVQSTVSEEVSWSQYDQTEHSGWFYARSVLAFVSLLQLFFAYSLSLLTIIVVVSTSIYQIVIFFVAFGPGLGWVSRLYVPYFLRCWPLRQYYLFILDSIALMTTRNRKIDLVRLAAGPLTTFICMVFTAAGIFRIDQTFQHFPLNIAAAVYFIVVTVTTVGFGDITPKTKDGYAIVIVIIFVFVSQMPTYIQVIRSTAKILKAFSSYKGRKNHFIVYGLVTREEAISILDEVFCLYPMKSVCFCNKEFSPDVASIGRHPTYRLRCTFLLTDNLDSFALKRMKAADAAGVIIFPIREGFSSRVDDDVMLTSLIFERLLPGLPQYVWLRYGLHVKLLKGIRASVIDEHIKKNIMATSLLLPGIIPFMVNLVRTAWTQGEEPANLWNIENMKDWKNQYEYSRRNVLSSCAVPNRFIGLPLKVVVSKFKHFDVLIVAIEESSTQTMTLNLSYIVCEGDVLMAIYERNKNRLAEALQVFSSSAPLENDEDTYGMHFRHSYTDEELLRQDMNASCVFYPYATSQDIKASQESSNKSAAVSEETIKAQLESFSFIPAEIQGIPIQDLHFNTTSLERASLLIRRYEVATNDPYTNDDEKINLMNNIENMLLTLITEAANDFVNALSEPLSEKLQSGSEEVFLFVDQTTSILRKTSVSIYEDVISQTIAQYELFVMFQCIRSIHADSKLTLLTLRKYSPEFLEAWQEIFKTPLRYIRGQGSLDAHLSYALGAGGRTSKVRGILLYCSQMGPRDFGDVPIFSVENSVRELLEWDGKNKDVTDDFAEQNITVELQSLTSSVKVTPFHNDLAWKERGEQNFQDALAFMMGRCFSSNMLLPLMVHCHRDSRIVRFFELCLNLSSTATMFDKTMWASRVNDSQILFKLCGNKALQFETFGDAFEFLLTKRSCVAIGMFRLFPPSEGLAGSPRYFITNPPLCTPMLVEDIVYCLDGTGNVAQK